MLWLSWLPASLAKIRSKVKSLSPGQHFLHYKSMGKFVVAQGRVTPKWMVQYRPNSNFCEILWLSLLPTSMMKIRSKMKSLSIGQHFPHYKSIGAFDCRGNQDFDPICPKTLCSFPPAPMRLLIVFDQDIQVWKSGRTTTNQTDGGPLVYYKLTLWAFGSGELNKIIVDLRKGGKRADFDLQGNFQNWL